MGDVVDMGQPVELVDQNTDSIGVSGNPLEVISGGYPTFVVYASNVAVANNKSMLSIANASDGTKIVRLREIKIRNTSLAAITGAIIEERFYRFTTHASGSSLTPLPRDTSNSLDANITVRTGATITGEAANPLECFQLDNDNWGTGALNSESFSALLGNLFPAFFVQPGTQPIVIRPGEGLHIKNTTNIAVGTFDFIAIFTQETV